MSGKLRKVLLHVVCVFMAFLTVFQLTGCGGIEGEKQTQTGGPARQEVLWQGESFGEISPLTEGSPVYLVEYQEGLENLSREDYDFKSSRYLGCYQDKIYIYTTCYKSVDIESDDGTEAQTLRIQRYYLTAYDLNTKERENREIFIESPAEGGAVTAGGEIVLFRRISNDEVMEHYYAVYMDMSGNVRKTLDLYPAMCEFGLESDESVGGVDYDSRGYLFVRDAKKPRVGVVDETGALIDTMELVLEMADPVIGSLKSSDGIAMFEVSGIKGNINVTTLFWYDDEKSDISILGEIGSGGEYVFQRHMNQYGEIYYPTDNNLVRWNWRTGVREKIFNCSANAISKGLSWKYCVTDGLGQLFLLDLSGDTSRLYGFSETEPVYESTLRIADIDSLQPDEFVQSCAAGFSRNNPLYHVEYELADHNRIINEIVSGKGPEILIVNREDMEILYEKGVIQDLSGILSKETEEQIYSSVLETGKIEGKQVGMALSASGSTLYVSRDVWQKDTWSVEEFVNLVEEREGELDDIFVGLHPMIQTPSSIFQDIALKDLKNSPFFDWEKGECYFDSSLFRKVLEISKRYGKIVDLISFRDQNAFQKAGIQELKEGRALAYEGWGPGSIHMFSQEMAKLGAEFGEDFYNVGFPTGEESGTFLIPTKFFVVNARAESKDVIYDFLRYFYDYDTQRSAGTVNVRKDVMRTFVVLSGYRNNEPLWVFRFDGGSGVTLDAKPDGSSWLEEYLECMEGSIPAPTKSQNVYDMIQEEVEYYFDGARDIDQTIDVLQKRVQLYLDEHKM